MMDNDLAARVDAIEETLETTYRPIADVASPDRLLTVERNAYDAQVRMAVLEARLAHLEKTAGEAHQMAHAVFHSRIWQALARLGEFLARLTGGGSHRVS